MNIVKHTFFCLGFAVSCCSHAVQMRTLNFIGQRSTVPNFRAFGAGDERLIEDETVFMNQMNDLINCTVEYSGNNNVVIADVDNGVESWQMLNPEGYQLLIENDRYTYSGHVVVTRDSFEARFDFNDFLQVRLPDNSVHFNYSAAAPYILNPYEPNESIDAPSVDIDEFIDIGRDLIRIDLNEWVHSLFKRFYTAARMVIDAGKYNLTVQMSFVDLMVEVNGYNIDNPGFMSIREEGNEMFRINLSDCIINGRFIEPDLPL